MVRSCSVSLPRATIVSFRPIPLGATYGGGEANVAVSLANYGMGRRFCYKASEA